MASFGTSSVAAAMRRRSTFEIVTSHLDTVPVHRAIIRSMECRRFLEVDLEHPILDVGCGDGHFASVLFAEPIHAGIDVDPHRVQDASKLGVYRMTALASATAIPYRDGSFRSVISNCVLEHIPDLASALREIARVLASSGTFVFSVPSQHFPEFLLGSHLLKRLGLSDAGAAYGRWFNRISRHYHCYSAETWRELLHRAALEVERIEPYMSPRAHWVFDLSHYYGAPTLLWKKLFHRWVLVPSKWKFWPPEALLARFISSLVDERPTDGAYLFIVCRKSPD